MSTVVVYERDVRIESVGGKQIVVIEVPRADRSDKPVYVGDDVYKGTFRRNGEGDYRCSREDVTAMIRDSCAETAEAARLRAELMKLVEKCSRVGLAALPSHLYKSGGSFSRRI